MYKFEKKKNFKCKKGQQIAFFATWIICGYNVNSLAKKEVNQPTKASCFDIQKSGQKVHV